MSCILCTSWAHCPVNPESVHPRKRTEVVATDVEVALITGYMWGTFSDVLCNAHRAMVEEMKKKLGIPLEKPAAEEKKP